MLLDKSNLKIFQVSKGIKWRWHKRVWIEYVDKMSRSKTYIANDIRIIWNKFRLSHREINFGTMSTASEEIRKNGRYYFNLSVAA